MIRVDGHEHLFRENSGAIINTDSSQYNTYMRMKSERKRQREEIDAIKNDISEIKSLLLKLVDKNN